MNNTKNTVASRNEVLGMLTGALGAADAAVCMVPRTRPVSRIARRIRYTISTALAALTGTRIRFRTPQLPFAHTDADGAADRLADAAAIMARARRAAGQSGHGVSRVELAWIRRACDDVFAELKSVSPTARAAGKADK